jgi:hypothetical protein
MAIAALLMVAALSAVIAGSATASWFINGVELGKGSKATLASTAKVDTTPVLRLPTIGVKIACKGTGLRGTKQEIIGANIGKVEGLTLEGCETTEPTTGCQLAGQPVSIKTNPLEETLALGSTKTATDKILIKAQTKKTIEVLRFNEANTCALNGEEPVNGSLTENLPTGQDEEELQAIEGLGSTENNSLEVAGIKSYLEGGKTLLKLASGAYWSFGAGELDTTSEENEEYKDKSVNEPVSAVGMLVPRVNVAVEEPYLRYLTGPNGSAFSIPRQTCSGMLTAGSLCEIEVTFDPSEAGEYLSVILTPVTELGGSRREIARIMLIGIAP